MLWNKINTDDINNVDWCIDVGYFLTISKLVG